MINNILLYNSGGGLGDSLQLIPIINSLKARYKSSNIYILGAHQNHFNNRLKDFGIKTIDYEIYKARKLKAKGISFQTNLFCHC